MDTLSSKHMIFLISGAAIVSLNSYSSIFIRTGGRDSWLAMITASVIILLIVWYFMSAMKRSNCYDIKEIHYKAYGKTLGSIILFLYALMLLITAVECSAVEANSIHTNLFIETPMWYLILFFIVPAVYPIKKGYTSIFLTTIITVILIYLAFATTEVLAEKYKDYNHLLPLMQVGLHKNFLKSILQILGVYGSLFIVLPYISGVLEKKRLTTHFVIGTLILSIISIYSMIGIIASFGPARASNIFYPKILQSQRIYFGGFIEFGELYILIQIVANYFIKYIIAFYAFVIIYKNMFNKRPFAYYFISFVIFIASYAVSKNTIIFFSLLNFYSYLSFIGFIVIPFLTFTLLFLRGGKYDKNLPNT